MASLRDVLNNIGRPAVLERGGTSLAEFLATRRGALILIEPRAEPQVGDRIRFTDSGEGFRVLSVAAEKHLDRLDHYRLEVAPA